MHWNAVDRRPRGHAPRFWTISLAISLAVLPACVSEEDVGPVVILPPEAYRYERFIESPTELTADRVLVQAVTAYKRDVAPIVDESAHIKEITPNAVRLINRSSSNRHLPVSLSFRNLRIRARERIEVKFSDEPLEEAESPPILLVIAEGVATFRGDGVSVTADRLVIRNDEIRAFLKSGQAIPVAGGRR